MRTIRHIETMSPKKITQFQLSSTYGSDKKDKSRKSSMIRLSLDMIENPSKRSNYIEKLAYKANNRISIRDETKILHLIGHNLPLFFSKIRYLLVTSTVELSKLYLKHPYWSLSRSSNSSYKLNNNSKCVLNTCNNEGKRNFMELKKIFYFIHDVN